MQSSQSRDPVDERLIDLIYSALLGETSWQLFLDELADTAPGGMAVLFFYDKQRNLGGLSLTSGISETMGQAFDCHYSRINPFMRSASVRPIGLGVLAEQMCDRESLVRTEFYNDYMRGIGSESAVGVTVMREEGRSFLLSQLTSEADLDRNRQFADRLTRLAPHLRRAFDFYRGPRTSSAMGTVGGPLFDAVDIGVVVVSERRALRHVSPTGEQFLTPGGAIRTSHSGAISIRDEEADDVLGGMLDRSYCGPRSARRIVDGQRITFVRLDQDRFSEYFAGPTVVLLMESLVGAGKQIAPEELAALYGLTRAESRALAGLLQGQQAAEIAETWSVSRETVRSQIKSLYAKMGVGRHVDLIRLISQL